MVLILAEKYIYFLVLKTILKNSSLTRADVKFWGYLAIIRISSIFCKWYDPSIYEFWINGSNKGRHSSWSCSPMKLLRIKNNFSVGNRRKPQHNFGKCFEKYGVLVENQETRMKTVFWKIQIFFFNFFWEENQGTALKP